MLNGQFTCVLLIRLHNAWYSSFNVGCIKYNKMYSYTCITFCVMISLFFCWYSTYGVPAKEGTKLTAVTPSDLNRFQNSFTDRFSRRTFAVEWLLNIWPHLKHVAILRCTAMQDSAADNGCCWKILIRWCEHYLMHSDRCSSVYYTYQWC